MYFDYLQTGEAAFRIRNYIVKRKEQNRCDLEPNHTHFLLFDDGTTKPEHVLPLRANIEMQSRCIRTRAEIMDTLIPIVMVLLEGGSLAIQSVCGALKSNTPVVVVKVKNKNKRYHINIHILLRTPVVLLILLLNYMEYFLKI
jgi:hypothetical protein